MKFTHNSLATIIGWVSTCLLTGGASTLFNETSRTMWMSWGCFGLASAVGLDVTARVRERKRMGELNVIANQRFEREMKYAADDKEANAAIREAVAYILGHTPSARQVAGSRRVQQRYLCNLAVELFLPPQGIAGSAEHNGISTRLARLTNISASGFELTLTEPLPLRRMEMIITAANGGQQKMFGEVLWDVPQADGSIVAGGRFLDALSVEDEANSTGASYAST